MNTKRILNDIINLIEEIFIELQESGVGSNKNWEELIEYEVNIQNQIDSIRQDLKEE